MSQIQCKGAGPMSEGGSGGQGPADNSDTSGNVPSPND